MTTDYVESLLTETIVKYFPMVFLQERLYMHYLFKQDGVGFPLPFHG